ncbi:MAG: PA2169 family four-helix-bundle protein [Alphaproteobacteria bacterium]|nr:PA2169 family four-helix-bundle protein [Alphaproteobacteria bacterium]MBV9371176.1 PA2169 family four-helix-bundle protein [Alphaproteobacteria bacterium]MBV9901179.1 PA2169 family four-helix-bundle protein [Alphaproteobacteria bacterium]
MFDQNHDISVLNSLIETTIDSIDGYQHSASEASNSRFAESFRDRASEREQVVAKLRDRVRALGGTPESDGGLLAAAHRQFLSLRDAVTGSDDGSIIAEVDRGESYLDSKWKAALEDTKLSDETLALIRQGYESVREGHRQWEAVNKGLSAAS